MFTRGTTGILTAMPEELGALLEVLSSRQSSTASPRSTLQPSAPRETDTRREFHTGKIAGCSVVVAFSRWGKVAAAMTTMELLLRFHVDRVIFCGIAGGLDDQVSLGDVVVATDLVQHDLDASPFFRPTEVPLLGLSLIPTDQGLSQAIALGASDFCNTKLEVQAGDLGLRAGLFEGPSRNPQVHRGRIATGDQVISTNQARSRVRESVPQALCVEMEGAAAAQVCHEHGVAFACVRTISDSADSEMSEHSKPFFQGLAGVYTRGIICSTIEMNR